jgi:hypothetical protein
MGIMTNKVNTIKKLEGKIKMLEASVDTLQDELTAYGHLRQNGFLPEIGEPFFILLARDFFAWPIVEAWAYLRMGKFVLAGQALSAVLKPTFKFSPQHSNDPQIIASFKKSGEMKEWNQQQNLRGKS